MLKCFVIELLFVFGPERTDSNLAGFVFWPKCAFGLGCLDFVLFFCFYGKRVILIISKIIDIYQILDIHHFKKDVTF